MWLIKLGSKIDCFVALLPGRHELTARADLAMTRRKVIASPQGVAITRYNIRRFAVNYFCLFSILFIFACAASTDWNNPCDQQGSHYSVTECAKKQQNGGSQFPGAPSRPSSLTAYDGSSSSQVVLSWQDNSNNEDGFRIDRKLAGGTYAEIATTGVRVTNYQDNGLNCQTTYYYRVRAYNAAGDSDYTDEANVTTGTCSGVTIPTAPSGLTAYSGYSSQVDLSWQDNSPIEDGFKIERKTGAGGTYSEIATVGGGVTSYQDSGLTCETMYYYRVRAYNSAGDSNYTSEANVKTATCSSAVPAAPSGLTAAVVSSSQISIYWVDNSSDEEGFLVERKTGSMGTYAEIKSLGPNVTSFPDNGLSAGTTYYYRVRAYNAAGNSGYSNEDYAATSSGASATSPPVFILKWGSLGSTDGQFNEAGYMAIDSGNNLYVGDSQNNRVQKFSSDGTFITKWGRSGSADGQFGLSGGVAIGPGNTVYVADQNNYRIQRFTSTGTYLSKWGSSGTGDGQFGYFYSIAADKAGNVYVADRGNYRIQKFDSNGNFVTKWGSQGTGNGQFDFPSAITVDSGGYVYVTDYNNCRVQKFTSTVNYGTQWGSCGTGDGQFSGSINGIAVDSQGNVYVVDSGNSRVQEFTSNGVFITKWGSSGSSDGQFSSPVGIAIDYSGYIYVTEFGNDRIQKFGY